MAAGSSICWKPASLASGNRGSIKIASEPFFHAETHLIDRSRVVICDCTGRNPNVFYEVGIAHTLGREVVLITQNAADIPFDLRHLRYVPYLNNTEGRQALAAALEMRLTSLIAGS